MDNSDLVRVLSGHGDFNRMSTKYAFLMIITEHSAALLGMGYLVYQTNMTEQGWGRSLLVVDTSRHNICKESRGPAYNWRLLLLLLLS